MQVARLAFALSLVGLHGACTAGRSAPLPDLRSKLGITTAVFDSLSLLCLSISDPDLNEGQVVWVVAPWDPQSLLQSVVALKRNDSCPAERDPIPSQSTYTLRVLVGEAQSGMVNIALASAELAPLLQNGSVVVDMDRDGELEFFHACTSMEGLHLSVWSGPPAAGKRRWHRYVYLGYDLEPTCSEFGSGGAEHPI